MSFYGLNIGNLNVGSIASLIFFLVLISVAIIGVIMFWHWEKYSLRKRGAFLVEIIYLTGAIIFIGVAFFLLNKI